MSGPGGWLEGIASTIVGRRSLVHAALAAVTIALVVQVPNLRVDLSPMGLVADQPAAARRDAELTEWFGPPEEPIVVVVRAGDVLERRTLAWMDHASRHAAELSWARVVNGPTATPLPHHAPAERDDVDLDALEDDPTSLDVAPETGDAGAALAALASSDPARFPSGLISLAELHEGRRIVVAPLADEHGVDPRAPEILRERLAARDAAVMRLVSDDAKLAVVAVELRSRDDATAARAVRDLEVYLAEHPPPRGVTATLGGLPHVRTELSRELRADRELTIAIACIGTVLVLVLGFRSVRGVVLPAAAVGMSVAIAMGGMALLDEPITLLTNVIPPLLVTIGIGDAVFVLSRYDEERAAGHDPLEASRRTFRTMAMACSLTAATAAAGFASLAVSSASVLRRFGITAAVTLLAGYVVIIVFIPSALAWFRSEPRAKGRTPLLDRAVASIASHAIARPRTTATVVLVVGALGACAAPFVRTDAGLVDQLDGSSSVARTTRALERSLHGVRRFDVALVARPNTFATASGLRRLADLESDLARERGVLAVTSAADLYASTWAMVTRDRHADDALRDNARVDALHHLVGADGVDPLRRFVTADGARARIEVRVADAGAASLEALLDRVEARVARFPDARGIVAGEAYVAARGLGRLATDLSTSLSLAIVVIFAMLGLALRNARLALIGLPSNLVALGVTMAWMAIRDIPLHATTIIVFAIGSGLAVDGTIHVLARYGEERREGGTPEEIVHRAIAGSGRPIILGAGALLLGFAALLVSGFPPIRLFGELSAVTIFTAVASELTLLPALLVMFGEPRLAASRRAR